MYYVYCVILYRLHFVKYFRIYIDYTSYMYAFMKIFYYMPDFKNDIHVGYKGCAFSNKPQCKTKQKDALIKGMHL